MRGTDDRLRSLLEAARNDRADPAVKGRVRAAVAARILAPQSGSPSTPESGSPSPAPGAGAAPSASHAITVSLGKAVIAAILTGAVGFAAGLSIDRGHGSPGRGAEPMTSGEQALSATPSVADRAPLSPATTAASEAAPATAQAPDSPPPARANGADSRVSLPSRSHAAPKGTANDPARDDARGSALAAELSLLREVQGALREGDSARAERWIDEHAARYPDGVLREEREAARILLLCAQGRAKEARAAADRFLAESPRSVQADRVRGSCAFAADAGAP